jgi:type III secretion system YscQ/HrcQ family protein
VSTNTSETRLSHQDAPSPEPGDRTAPGPLGLLPRLSRLQVRLEHRLARLAPGRSGFPGSGWLAEALGSSPKTSRPELLMRGSGVLRPGLVAQLLWPSRRTRVGLGIETPLAHAIVDRLLGFERTDAESRRQLTPVEWGILTFVVARCLEELSQSPGPFGLDDLVLDRVGPDVFATADLGAIVTLRWSVQVDALSGAVRLWIPLDLLTQCLDDSTSGLAFSGRIPPLHEMASVWRAEAGTIAMPRGLGRLRVGGVLPIDGQALEGSPESPRGAVRLVLDLADRGGRCTFAAEAVPHSGGGRLTLTSTLQKDPIPRESLSMSSPSEPPPPSISASAAPADIPVTMVVELGRVNLTLAQLADLKPGDVLELGRHSREPVELTSGGRLVARGELVQIDTELGVRVTHVFL